MKELMRFKMPSALKVTGIVVGVLVVVGVVVGSLTWAILANKGPDPPELIDLDWYQYMVLYQIYPRSYKDSDGDGIGDLKGITSELEHFVDAGVDAVWLSPIFTSPMIDFGYDVSNFYEIHDEYGTMADFEEMIEKAHALGLKVLLDYVPNHASTFSEYFIKSEARDPDYDNWFIWADPIVDPDNSSNLMVPTNWVSEFTGTIWEWSEIRQQYYLHQFAIEQADFNFREPKVREEMMKILGFWYDKGVDGFRLDALPYIYEVDPADFGGVWPDEPLSGNAFATPDEPEYTTRQYTKDLMELYEVVYEWRQFNDEYQRENGGDTKVMLAEAYTNISRTMLYYGDENGRLGSHFPFNFDFITSLSAESDARDFVYTILHWMTYMPSGATPNWVFGNHDNHRMPTRFGDDMVDGLNSLNMMLPGAAITYQGEEIGMRNGFVSWEQTVDVNALNKGDNVSYITYSRDPARTPYHWDSSTSAGFSANTSTWLPVADDYLEINLARQKEEARSHYKVYQAMTSLRKNAPALSHGLYQVDALTEFTLVLVRYLITHDTYALVFNVGKVADVVDLSTVQNLAEPIEVYISSTHSSRVAGDSISLGEITLQPNEALVLKAAPTTS